MFGFTAGSQHKKVGIIKYKLGATFDTLSQYDDDLAVLMKKLKL